VAICRVLTEILAHFPAYRIYARPGHITPADQAVLERAVEGAQKTSLPGDAWLVDTLGAWLAGQTIREDATRLQAIAMARFQQLTAPLCAKAVEDTAFYRYGRLLSRNDVGFDPRVFALPLREFHRKMQQRAAALPHSMLATATHDHKRGEDVRARLAVLSELPEEWSAAVKGWLAGSEVHCQKADGTTMPTAADRAILFQTIVGAWPFSLEIGDDGALAAFRERVVTWQTKALREAKLHTDWLAPNERYEQAASEFVSRLLSGPSNLLAEIARFSQRIAAPGAVNGLGQVLVKLTAPGVPDTFQGTEFWDLSLVDPDNRSAVDFAARQKAQGQPVQGWKDGSAKQHVIARTLALRRTMPAVFAAGSYLPLETAGPLARHVAAYARIAGVSAAIIVFTRFAAKLLSGEALTVSDWGSTHILVPQNLYGDFTDALAPTPSSALCVANKILLGPILQALPIALLACEAVSV
jgi:malto-oligosyltrehalose synthase